MRDHDLELIAAFVEGRLEDETEARALIETSEEARLEYEAQRRAHEALRSLQSQHLTDAERSALHRDVWSALRSDPQARPARDPWYYGWVPAAAAAGLVLIGIVGVLGGGLGGQDAADIFQEVGTGPAERTTSTLQGQTAGDGDDAGSDLAPFHAPSTTAAASGEAVEESVSPETRSFLTVEAARLRAGGAEPTTTTADETSPEASLEACLLDAGLVDHIPVDTVEPPEDSGDDRVGIVIAAVPEGIPIEEAPITFVAQDSCAVVHVDE